MLPIQPIQATPPDQTTPSVTASPTRPAPPGFTGDRGGKGGMGGGGRGGRMTTMPVKPGMGQTGGPKPYTGPARPVPSQVYTPANMQGGISTTGPVTGGPFLQNALQNAGISPAALNPATAYGSAPSSGVSPAPMGGGLAMKKGGAVKKKAGGSAYSAKIDLGQCKVSTASRNKKNSNW